MEWEIYGHFSLPMADKINSL